MPASRSRILSVALIVSVAVNLIIGGFVAAQWYDYGFGKKRPKGTIFDRHAAMDVLKDDQRDQARKIWKDRRSLLKPHFKAYHQTRQQLASLLGAEALDESAINATYSDMIAKRMEIEGLLKQSLLEFARSLPPEQRAAFFAEGFKSPKRYKKQPKDKGN
ncbi:MAG: periplasmic heavy metal sensor [Proteobacteria bacterium]|nr:periplasmic heavy metal sensor [Pseudomonadota bacterium]